MKIYVGPRSTIWPRTPKHIGPAPGGSTVEDSGATAKASGDHAEALEQREAPISKGMKVTSQKVNSSSVRTYVYFFGDGQSNNMNAKKLEGKSWKPTSASA